MALLTFSLLFNFVIFVSALILSVYIFYRHRFRYWGKRKIPHTIPTFPLGDFSNGLGRSKSFGEGFKDIYLKHKNEKLVGMWIFAAPVLHITDLELLKSILVKDFNHFHDRGFRFDEELDPLAGHLFAMSGQKWRNLRVKLAPTFTSGKMKMMYPTIIDVCHELKRILEEVADKGNAVEVKDLMSRFTTDVVASTVFGLSVSSLKNPDSEFRKKSKAVRDTKYIDLLKQGFYFINPSLASFLKIRVIPTEISQFFMNVVKKTFEYREKNSVERNDFMQLLIQLKNKGFIEDADAEANSKEARTFDFTVENAAAQAFIFLSAGFETSASTIMFALYELAINPDLQDALQKELDSSVDGELAYDTLHEMNLLDRVISETLRKYPVASLLARECSREYTVPGTDIVIEKGTRIIISVMGIHYNPDIYTDPERFDPDRFLPEEKKKRDRYAYIPFGEGPRICIGSRFGLTQTKAGLATILLNFKVIVCEKTTIPLALNPAAGLLSAKGGLYLKFEKRNAK